MPQWVNGDETVNVDFVNVRQLIDRLSQQRARPGLRDPVLENYFLIVDAII